MRINTDNVFLRLASQLHFNNRHSATGLSPGCARAEEDDDNPADNECRRDEDANPGVFGKSHKKIRLTNIDWEYYQSRATAPYGKNAVGPIFTKIATIAGTSNIADESSLYTVSAEPFFQAIVKTEYVLSFVVTRITDSFP